MRSPARSPFLIVGLLLLDTTRAASLQAPPTRAAATRLQDLSHAFESVVERVSPSVVQIVATGYAGLERGSETTVLTRQRAGGSGVILDPNGYIVTNAHVVANARRIQVVLPLPRAAADEQRSILKPHGATLDAVLVGLDRETDLAVVKVDRQGLPALAIANFDDVRQGQIVFAFGSPLNLDNSVTMGIVSSVARQRAPEDPMIYLQTDASINPGNSGGPLVDVDGRLVGINTFILSQSGGSEGLGFAAPCHIVKAVYENIRSSGRLRRGTLGVYSQTVTPALAAGLGLPVELGVILGDVVPGGPADAAGLEPGDVILLLDGKQMENARQLEVNVYPRRVGDTVAIEYLRQGERKRTTAAVGEVGDDPERFADLVDPEDNLVPRLGILGIEITAQIRARVPLLRLPGGVLVAARSADAALGDERLQPGDVITAVNGKLIAGLPDLREEVARVRPRSPCVLQIQRSDRLMFVTLDLE
jgi:serine protease Do